MNTHIIISVESIENMLDNYLNRNQQAFTTEERKITQSAYNALQKLYEQSKQISLDEKDIEENAKNADFKNPYNRDSFKNGYKQALKNLL